MPSRFTPLLILCCAMRTAAAQDIVVPAELKSFIQPGYDVMDLVKEDLNGDRLKDYILVFKIAGEDTISFDNPRWDAARPLTLIIRQPGGSLKLMSSSSSLVLCRNCGGVMGDPYQGITAKPGEFTVSFYGGSSWRWSEEYTFRYDKQKKDWLLETHKSASFHSGDPEKTMEETTIRRGEIGDIPLPVFTPGYNTDSSTWKVKTAKTFFYASPVLLSKPKRSYLVKGNTLVSSKQFKNFIGCSYTNEKGDVTQGYILKKDLELVNAYIPRNLR